jgi:hypothetical protein
VGGETEVEGFCWWGFVDAMMSVKFSDLVGYRFYYGKEFVQSGIELDEGS